MNKEHVAIVLGLFETGLGVIRSLGREGVKVIGLDSKIDIGTYSRYAKTRLCPDPINDEQAFIDYLIALSKEFDKKPALFVSADNYLFVVSENREQLEPYYLMNFSPKEKIRAIADKYEQYKLAVACGIDVPYTFLPKSKADISEAVQNLAFPLLMKALDVNVWRLKIGGSLKGFVIQSEEELMERFDFCKERDVDVIVQEIILGPDTNHFKFCGYVSKSGELLRGFTLKKLRQNPIRFGVGTSVESIEHAELMEVGKKFFKGIDYIGVGSAEFKKDERDGKLKLIELNPRYWQQNVHAQVCGMNFAWADYLELTGQEPKASFEFKKGIKWVNIYSDFESYLDYKKEGELTFSEWRKSISGKKVWSDFAWDDMKPGFYEIEFGKRLIKIPFFLIKKLFR